MSTGWHGAEDGGAYPLQQLECAWEDDGPAEDDQFFKAHNLCLGRVFSATAARYGVRTRTSSLCSS